jgi:hypothetical protein
VEISMLEGRKEDTAALPLRFDARITPVGEEKEKDTVSERRKEDPL